MYKKTWGYLFILCYFDNLLSFFNLLPTGSGTITSQFGVCCETRESGDEEDMEVSDYSDLATKHS